MAVALNFQTGREAVITFCLFNMGKMNDFFHPQKMTFTPSCVNWL